MIRLRLRVSLPEVVVLIVDHDHDTPSKIEVTGLWLMGLRINADRVENCIEFWSGPDPDQAGPSSPRRTLITEQPGRFVWDIFDTDPLAYHLHQGNQIRI